MFDRPNFIRAKKINRKYILAFFGHPLVFSIGAKARFRSQSTTSEFLASFFKDR